MEARLYTIGEAARQCGMSVRTLRFYSDTGLLPPVRRGHNGYRLYTDADLVRLDLIRALRETGLGLDAIRRVLLRRMTLQDALRLRLAALEAEIASKSRIVSAIRAALRETEPGDDDLRRLWAMTKISRAERRAVIRRFYDQVSEGTRMDPEWKFKLVEASVPELPDEPTPEQIDAWIELSEIVSDPSFVAAMRSKAALEWQPGFDRTTATAALAATFAKARAAAEAGHPPQSADGEAIAREWIAAAARAVGREPDDVFKAYLRSTFADRDPRKARYWELVAILRGEPPDASPNREWRWFIDAVRHYLA